MIESLLLYLYLISSNLLPVILQQPMRPHYEPFYRLRPTVNQYDWGRERDTSLVYKLYQRYLTSAGTLDSDAHTRYSELWLGTHPSGHATVQPSAIDTHSNDDTTHNESKIYLSSLLRSLSNDVKPIKPLNILFKVISIDRPLSLQVHPDVHIISTLHQKDCESIVDHSDKPEMCVALTKFRAISGFKPLNEIINYVNRHEGFAKILGNGLLSRQESVDEKDVYTWILKKLLLENVNESQILSVVNTIEQLSTTDLTEECVLILYKNYGCDTCVLFPFVMNCIDLDVGDALFVPPNTLHSYISGESIEIMKCSDNVIRCGLTNKHKDVHSCIDVLEHQLSKDIQSCREIHYVYPESTSKFTLKYKPRHPSSNFTVYSIIIPPNEMDTISLSVNSLAILINTNSNVQLSIKLDGSLTSLNQLNIGDCFLFLPGTTLDMRNDGVDKFVMFIAQESSQGDTTN